MTTTTTPARLRPARAEDLPAVKRLLAASGLPLDGVDESFGDAWAVAESEGALAGVAGVEIHGSSGLLRSVAVAEKARGRGVGEALVRNRIDFARERGIERLLLLTTTAANWFERLSFRRVPRAAAPAEVMRSREFQGACPDSAVLLELPLGGEAIREAVRERYGAAARRAGEADSKGTSCCSTSCCGGDADAELERRAHPITAGLYDANEAGAVPEGALRASLGCGNPTALARLAAGETVLDLGSGGGIDVLLSARRVGPTGKAYGLDMTDEMLALARENQRKSGLTNVEFLKGEIEAIPLPDASVDVVVSNCVINLTADKRRALREAFRVLKPGGRLAVSDIVVRGAMPERVRRSVEAWVGCIAGALEEEEYAAILREIGFEDVSMEAVRVYRAADAREFLAEQGLADAEVDEKFASAFVRGRKPLAAQEKSR